VRDDARDTLVLEGHVANQIVLVRVLTLAAQLFTGQAISQSDIRVVADEAGALADQSQAQGQSQQSQLGGGATASLFGGSRGNRLTNQVRTNLGRAKAIEAAGGQIISFIEVTDLPQVRVDIRLLEVNRTKLRAWNPNTVLLTSDFRQPSLNPAQSAVVVQGDQAARPGSVGAAIQNVLSFLNGGLLNELQYSGGHLAIDTALSLLEREGIAQSLSSPSLTVLVGELAQVQIGGEVPVPTAFAPAFGAVSATTPGAANTTPGVFSSVEFVPFGVQLQIRPLVGDDDTITLDVQPLVVTPDAVLTDTIARPRVRPSRPRVPRRARCVRARGCRTGRRCHRRAAVEQHVHELRRRHRAWRSVPILGRMFQSFTATIRTPSYVCGEPGGASPLPSRRRAWAFPARG
jgi:Flp pilus assembly secretin CpaC